MATIVTPQYPFAVYPGGVIALRCIDYMAPGSSTLSTESDTRSIAGTVVRETQQVVNMKTEYDYLQNFLNAEDSLVIDLANLPVEQDMQHVMLISYLTEGDWNINAPAPYGDNSTWRGFDSRISALLWYGDSYHTTESDPSWWAGYVKRKIPKYTMVTSQHVMQTWDGTEVLHIRAFSEEDSTIEFLLDSIYIIPYQYNNYSTKWTPYDFNMIGGGGVSGHGESPDGADNGDSLGKFTLHPYPIWEADDDHWFAASAGGGDYQKKSGPSLAEYFAKLGIGTWMDYYDIYDSTKGTLTEASEPKSAHCYGLHGTYYVEETAVVDDHFSRTLYDGDMDGPENHFEGSNWGKTPEGFGWSSYQTYGPWTAPNGVVVGSALWVDNDKAWMHISREFQSDFQWQICTLGPSQTNPQSPRCFTLDNINLSGKFSVHYSIVDGDDPWLHINIYTGENTYYNTNNPYISFDCVSRTWTAHTRTDQYVEFAGPFDISSWWAGSSEVGFRIEIARYRIRIRVWDASDSEPSGWDVDQYRPFYVNVAPDYVIDYPYNDDLYIAQAEDDIFGPCLEAQVGYVTLLTPGFRVAWDDIRVETNTIEGPIQNTHYAIERPHGTVIEQIELDSTADYLVYWGTRDWTDWDALNEMAVIGFSAKSWSPIGAPKMQRAENYWWWFRSAHGGAPKIIRYR